MPEKINLKYRVKFLKVSVVFITLKPVILFMNAELEGVLEKME